MILKVIIKKRVNRGDKINKQKYLTNTTEQEKKIKE